MNEILKKRIEEAAREGSKHYDPNVSKYSQGKQVGYIRGFNEGAEYALSHQWISVEEALPELNKEVLVLFPDGTATVTVRCKTFNADGRDVISWKNGDYTYADSWIKYWMPIPKFEPYKTE